MSHDALLAILGGSTGTMVFVAFSKWLPDWPITPEKIYNWLKHSIQEVAAQRSGGNPPTPPTPTEPKGN